MKKFIDSISDVIFGEKISNNMHIDNNGQLICENVVLARTGFYDYREDELIEGGSQSKILRVYRPPEEVFDPLSIRSMNYKPFVDEHPDDNVTPETVGELQKGFMTNVRRGTGEFAECLMADLVVTDPAVIELIRSGKKRELSVGYTADIEENNGKYFMKNIRGNHIALCEAGRAGNARIRDSKGVTDYEAVGSFSSMKELVSNYKGAKVTPDGKEVIVELSGGGKFLYKYVSGESGKLAFVRRMKDSGCFVSIGDSLKLCEGQRVIYFGDSCVVSSIVPNGRDVLVEFSDGIGFVGCHSHKDIKNLFKRGDIEILDRSLFDEDEEIEDCDVIELEDDCEIIELEDARGSYLEVYDEDELVDPAHEKELDRTHFIDEDEFETFDLIEDSLRQFQVVVDGRKFVTMAKDESTAVRKVRDSLKCFSDDESTGYIGNSKIVKKSELPKLGDVPNKFAKGYGRCIKIEKFGKQEGYTIYKAWFRRKEDDYLKQWGETEGANWWTYAVKE